MRRPLDGYHRITGDDASHAAYGVGPATDYGADYGEIVRAPFSGTVARWWSPTGGNTVRVSAPGLAFIGQHLQAYRETAAGFQLEGTALGEVGSTGSSTDGPHLHCWIEVDGDRRNFENWINWLASAGLNIEEIDMADAGVYLASIDAKMDRLQGFVESIDAKHDRLLIIATSVDAKVTAIRAELGERAVGEMVELDGVTIDIPTAAEIAEAVRARIIAP